jgi:hypothetical protein
MLNRSLLTGALLLALLAQVRPSGAEAPVVPGGAPPAAAMAPSVRTGFGSPMDLRLELRRLWVEHIIYTRSYIVSTLAGLPDKKVVASRLMANQDSIGAAIVPYYGREAGSRLAKLLREHITIAADVVAMAMAGDPSGLKDAQARWADNGSRMADFLGATNPYWARPEIAMMLTEHLATTTAEVKARLAGDWKGDLANFDLLTGHMLLFADYLAAGVQRQFPDRFTAGP